MLDKNPKKIQNMFNEIAKNYDFLNNLISLGTHKIIKKITFNSLKIKKEAKILDLCTGTGDVAYILKKKEPSAHVLGVDFSENMLEISKKRYEKSGIEFLKGDVCALNFKDDFFDILSISFGLRNIENQELTIKEIKRVLKKNGVFAYLDFSCEGFFFNFIFDKIVILFAKLFTKNQDAYRYLIKSKKEFKTPNILIKEFENEGFKCISKKTFLFNLIAFLVFEKI